MNRIKIISHNEIQTSKKVMIKIQSLINMILNRMTDQLLKKKMKNLIYLKNQNLQKSRNLKEGNNKL